jgi:hypothetical protein
MKFKTFLAPSILDEEYLYVVVFLTLIQTKLYYSHLILSFFVN